GATREGRDPWYVSLLFPYLPLAKTVVEGTG
ncbi:hypothetical protein A2U01_0109744, partial [Trifolium medium]|nr:hypothetical protein [Trifolium medium]